MSNAEKCSVCLHLMSRHVDGCCTALVPKKNGSRPCRCVLYTRVSDASDLAPPARMRLWFLDTDDRRKNGAPDMESATAMVIRAPHQSAARQVAAKWALGEGQNAWLDSEHSTCVEIGETRETRAGESEPGLILRQTEAA